MLSSRTKKDMYFIKYATHVFRFPTESAPNSDSIMIMIMVILSTTLSRLRLPSSTSLFVSAG